MRQETEVEHASTLANRVMDGREPAPHKNEAPRGAGLRSVEARSDGGYVPGGFVN